jgi:large repetitive protein
VPDALRGKVATLKFELSGGEVYIDNVFFKSQSLLFGNPTEARTDIASYNNNYLLEKPQFTVSYSQTSNIPNWSAWQVNQSWINTPSVRPDDEFFRDPSLESLGWASAKDSDYARPLSDITPGPTKPDGTPLYKLAPGHLSPNADRGRNLKDTVATFSTSNIVPQHGTHNNSIWKSLESFERNLADKQSREVYIYAGGAGQKNPVNDKATIVVNNDPTYGSYNLPVPAFLWKAFLVLDRPGFGIGDITDQNSKAFAVWTENTLPQPGSAPYTSWNNGGMEIITISELENRLNRDANNSARSIRYNFFSNISNSVQQHLKTTPIPIPSGSAPYSAFLMAETSQLDESLNISGLNISIGHDGVVEYGADKIWNVTDFSSSQIASSKVDVSHASSFEITSNELSIRQVSTIQDGVPKTGSTQISPFEVSFIKGSLPEMSVSQISAAQIDSIQHHFSQNSSAEINTSQIGTDQFIRAIDLDPTEIPLPSSITLQQFLSSHNFNLQNTTIPTWTEFLTGTTPFNLKIEITDLPTGQLAEANITHFDSNGRPTSGTLTLDIDANGLGWFIDSSPWDNAEFGTLNGETLFRATLGSEAYGHYDLLTTILHELGHLAGLISGNPTYDSRVQTINGNPIFQGNGYSTTLTTDRSHLADPTKLMGTYLAPGMRKLPSPLELQMLADLDTRGSIQVTNAAPAKTISTILNLLCNAV